MSAENNTTDRVPLGKSDRITAESFRRHAFADIEYVKLLLSVIDSKAPRLVVIYLITFVV